MTPLGLALDQPQLIEHDIFSPDISSQAEGVLYQLANQDVVFNADADANLHNFFWPWADEHYVRSIRLDISAPREEAFSPMATRLYPGHQETIYGSEGIIVGKQLAALLKSNYDRSALWLLDCQAEGDRLLRVDVEIDWGEPLSQRMVDGLLVAQRNPGPARGIYNQQNADSTRVFGNPQGRPDQVDIDDPQRAHLVYHVLINGLIEVPFLLAVSDVGEQVAWSGFLSLREGQQEFEKSSAAWQQWLRSGRLWTPDPLLNHAVHVGKMEAVYRVQRLRTGLAPTRRHTHEVPILVEALDTLDVTQARNLLAQMRRVAEQSSGRLPELLPVHSKEPLIDPRDRLPWTNGAYLQALGRHLSHHPDAELLADHFTAIGLCSEMVVRLVADLQEQHTRGEALPTGAVEILPEAGRALRHAVALALRHGDQANAQHWESVARDGEQVADELGGVRAADAALLANWITETGWAQQADGTWRFAMPTQGIALAGRAIWRGCGLTQTDQGILVNPTWDPEWNWWALLDLPLPLDATSDRTLSLVWDGNTLHATQPVQSHLPVQLHAQIRALNTDEVNFDLHFEFVNDADDSQEEAAAQRFKPRFITAE
jgi:hypothetical protein